MQARLCFAIAATLVPISCEGGEPPPIADATSDQISVSRLIATPLIYHQRGLIRVSGWCRVEFEHNALYVSRNAAARRSTREAVWLTLGWPVSKEIQALDGEHVTVEGRFDANNRGHFRAFFAALEDIRRIERSSPP
jgi:hypothetical protein